MRLSLLAALALALALAFAATAVSAHDFKAGPLVIDHPWARATPKGAAVAGGYMKITNTGTTPDRLVSGTTDAARKFEVHEMKMEGSVMRMRELSAGLDIPPGATVELKPGSYHIMMMNLAKPFVKGDKVKASLTFEKAGKVDIEFSVEAMGGNPAGADTKMKEHKH